MSFYNFFAHPPDRSRFYSEVVLNAGSQTSPFDLVQSFQELKQALMGICSNWPRTACPLLISMDEIHVLFNMRGHDAESAYSLYSRLKSVLSEAVSEDFCTIFLSTATSVSKLAPSKDVAPSARERDDDRLLPAPFTELPFDAYIISEPLVPEQATLKSVGSLEFTAKFGRPLYVDQILVAQSCAYFFLKVLCYIFVSGSSTVPQVLCGNHAKCSGETFRPTPSRPFSYVVKYQKI